MKYVIEMPPIKGMWSEQWNTWIEKYSFQRDDIEVIGTKKYIIPQSNQFTNIREYYKYFFKIMSGVIEDVRDGDTIFFMEGESAGIEALEYLRKLDDINLNIEMVFHGGSYLDWDTINMHGVSAKYFEYGWFDIANTIYVGSKYHADMIINKRGVKRDKVVVTGLPIDVDSFANGLNTHKKIDILYPSRLSIEKGYDVIDELRTIGYNIYCSKEHNLSKREFYRKILESKIVLIPSKTETFGISAVESLASNVVTIAPNDLAFPEYMPKELLYNDKNELMELLDKYLENYKVGGLSESVAKFSYKKVIPKWLG